MNQEKFTYPYSAVGGGYAPSQAAAPAAAAAAMPAYSSGSTGAAGAPHGVPTAATAAGRAVPSSAAAVYRGQVEPLQRIVTPQQTTYMRPGSGLPVTGSSFGVGNTGYRGGAGGGGGGYYQPHASEAAPAGGGVGFAFSDFFRVVRDKEKLSFWFSTHRGSLQAWTGFLVMVLLVYHLFSDGDFSFLMTLSSLISMFSFLMVVYKMEANGSAAGVSLKMMECYVVLIFARLCSIIPFEGYLPYDRSGDWLYQTVEALSFLLAGTTVYMCRSRYGSTYESGVDTLNHIFLMVPAAVLAVFFHPSLNAFMPADMAWTFALYLEAVAVLPQLFMFQKEGRVEPFTTHFLAGQVLSQVFSFIFWVSSYSELNGPQNSLKSYVGHWVIGMQVVQLIVMADFIYHYLRCISKGVPVQYMLSENV